MLVMCEIIRNFATVVELTAVALTNHRHVMKFYNRESEIAELLRIRELAYTRNSRMTVLTGRRIHIEPVANLTQM